MELRGYQQEDLHRVRVLHRALRSVLLVQPTGAGKGTLASYIVHAVLSRRLPVMFLVNRRNLVNDMSDRVSRLGIEHGVIMGDDKRYDESKLAQVASIDTVTRRKIKLPAALLIVDEAHFAVTETWRNVLAMYPESKVLGMTATPIRMDGRGLGNIFDAMVQGPSVKNLIQQNYLVPAVVFRPAGAKPVDLRKERNGDYNNQKLAAIADKPKLVGNIVEQWKKHALGRKTAAFGVNQKHAFNIAEQFRCAGFDWAYVDADTDDEERKRIWDGFDHGNLAGISSVGVISYGWDHPICSCIIGGRATASEQLWRQMLGRGGRIYPGKQNFYVLDHWDNTGQLNALYDDEIEWTLDGGAIHGNGKDSPSIVTCRLCYATFRAGPARCPLCLATIPKQDREIRTAAGELEKQAAAEAKARAIDKWREGQADGARREKFEEFRRIARERGYSRKWPFVRFKVIYGQYPPKEWGVSR